MSSVLCDMKIQVGGVSEGHHQYHFESTSSELGLAGSFSDDVTVDVALEKTGTQLFLEALIHADGRFQCDRCLTEFEVALPSSYKMYYFTEGGDQAQFDPAEVQIIPQGASVLDLTEDVRQTMLLSVPLKLLCSETCAGLCPHCGANLNTESCTCSETPIDTRWEKLRSLQNNQMDDPT
jgi:uncharacterized protein